MDIENEIVYIVLKRLFKTLFFSRIISTRRKEEILHFIV